MRARNLHQHGWILQVSMPGRIRSVPLRTLVHWYVCGLEWPVLVAIMTSLSLVQMWTNVRKIRAFVSTVAAITPPARTNASARKDSSPPRSVPSASIWTNAANRECAPTESASTWMVPSSVFVIPATSCRPMAKTALVIVLSIYIVYTC